MPRLSVAFALGKVQAELDFVDVDLSTDNELFVDPFALAEASDRWSQECHRTIVTFFQRILNDIRDGRLDDARELLSRLHEPNETRLGFSEREPQGAGIGNEQATQLFDALQGSTAVQTGFINSLEECELMIPGIGEDKISDLTTNIIRGNLLSYTQQQCELHGITRHNVPLPPTFDADAMIWREGYVNAPVWRGKPILLVPKAAVRFRPAYQHRKYYRHFVLEYLRAQELNANSRLVRTLKKTGERRVYTNALVAKYPLSKQFLYEFSRDHPDILQRYREYLRREERVDRLSDVDPADEPVLAEALAEALVAIQRGGEHASAYHRAMIGIIEFVFFPQLLHPRKEAEIHDGRKRIDILTENGAHEGIFYRLHAIRRLPCSYVAFECKNYSTEVANPEIDQLSGRFGVNRGKVGFLCCRHFENRALFVQRCRDTLRDDRGLILPLDDVTVLRLLETIQQGRRQDLETELSLLVDEVWIP